MIFSGHPPLYWLPMPPIAPLPVEFDDPPRRAPEGASEGYNVPERIARTLEQAGIDAPCGLYNEALELARSGHLGAAAGRLQMLLGLDPEDGDALLLMAKVLSAQERPAEALTRLDQAVVAGALPPAGLREYLENAIRAERAREEEQRARLMAREQGEIRALRSETRQLRSDTVRLETEVGDALSREQLWKLATLGTALFATGVVLALAYLPASGVGPATPVASPSVVVAAPLAVEPATTTASRSAPPQAPAASGRAAAAGTVHVVQSGDTLYKISKQHYGDASRWEQIQAANAHVLKEGHGLSLGMELKIP